MNYQKIMKQQVHTCFLHSTDNFHEVHVGMTYALHHQVDESQLS